MLVCPKCGSPKLIKSGTVWIKDGHPQKVLLPKYQCKSCGFITHKVVEK